MEVEEEHLTTKRFGGAERAEPIAVSSESSSGDERSGEDRDGGGREEPSAAGEPVRDPKTGEPLKKREFPDLK